MSAATALRPSTLPRPLPPTSRAARLQDFHRDLEQLLRRQVDQQPTQAAPRLKLLELLFEQHRREDFLRAARELQRQARPAPASREWQKVASMGRMLLPGESLFAGQDGDRIEFVGSAPAAVVPAEAQRRRFGDEERYRALFDDLARQYQVVRADPRFLAELELLLTGLGTRRPTPLLHARRLSQHVGGAQVYLKREDLAGDHPHLTVAVTGQALFARRLGRTTLVTGTVDGRRGLIAAAVAARLGLKARVFMDAAAAERAASQVLLMELMGAQIQRVYASDYRNRDIREAALDYWAKHPQEAFLLMGLDAAPAPYPVMTQEFTTVIGRECRRQLTAPGKQLPAAIVTRGSQTADAVGLFPAFLAEHDVKLCCVEPEVEPETHVRDAADPYNQHGVLNGSERKVAKGILDKLEYPSVSREHALLKASGRVDYVDVPRAEARQALVDLARLEGIVPPIETARALAWACRLARALPPDRSVVVVMAEPADKDVWDIQKLLGGRQPG